MRIFGIIAVVLIILIAGLFIMPAGVLGGLLEEQTEGRLTLSDTQGTIWSGSGFVSVVVDDGVSYALTSTPLVWRVEKLPVLWGEIVGELGFNGDRELPIGSALASFRVTRSEGEFRNISTPLNLPTVLKLAPSLVQTLKLGGTLQLDIKQLAWGNESLKVDSNIRWSNMRSVFAPQVNPLGSYNISINGTGNAPVDIALETIQGPLSLTGNGQWRPGKGYFFEGYAEPGVSALEGIMMLIGSERAGKWYFRFPAGGI